MTQLEYTVRNVWSDQELLAWYSIWLADPDIFPPEMFNVIFAELKSRRKKIIDLHNKPMPSTEPTADPEQ